MGKIRSTFRQITATTLKSKSDIPKQADITVNSGNIDCVNISLTQVKNVIGSSTFSVYDVCRHDNVNVWSQFGPTVRTYSNTGTWSATLVNSKPTQANLGDFAGYQHNPFFVPGYITTVPMEIWINSGSTATIFLDLNIGDFDYPNLGSNPGIVFVLFNSRGSIMGWSVQSFSSLKEFANLELTTIDPLSSNTTGWYAGVYITNSDSYFSSSEIQASVMCRVPNCNTFAVDIKVKQSTTFVWADTGTQSPPSPWSVSIVSMNWSSGNLSITNLEKSTDSVQLEIWAELTNWLNEVVGSVEIYNGPYTGFTWISGTFYVGMTSIPSLGYKVTIYITESI